MKLPSAHKAEDPTEIEQGGYTHEKAIHLCPLLDCSVDPLHAHRIRRRQQGRTLHRQAEMYSSASAA